MVEILFGERSAGSMKAAKCENVEYYDFIIWNRLTEKPVKECRLIGDILGQGPIGVGDWWYAARIEHFIRQGKIKVVEDSGNKYARLIKRYL